MRIYTIGHSTRTLDEFIGLLQENGVERLADIRRYPGSRRLPHFSSESLARALPDVAIAYEHIESLGGRRRPVADSPNGGLRNEQFRGYADHMLSPEFRSALAKLLADPRATAIMCAEAVPWRCHRNLVSDDLLRRGVEVIHILGPGSTRVHTLPSYARIEKDRVIYPPAQGSLEFGGL
jgi:uncharacterized protein (DUF488 family)